MIDWLIIYGILMGGLRLLMNQHKRVDPTLLGQLRKDLEHDRRFARKCGYILFQGDKFGRSPTTMNE